MCSPEGLTDFARNCIDNVMRDGLAEPALLILDGVPPKKSSLGEKARKALKLNGNLWYLQSKLFPQSNIPVFRRTSLDELFPRMDRIICEPQLKGKWSQYFSPADVERIQDARLDFIVKFAFGIIRGAVLSSARLGVWSFHHDDEERYRGGPPAFWEIYRGDPVSGALLQRLNDRLDGGIVLKKCWVPTDGRSYRKNLQRIQSCSWHMLRWVCLDVLCGNAGYLEAPPSKTNAPIDRAPTDIQMLAFWWRLARNWIRYKLSNQRVDEWNVGLVRAPQAAFLDADFQPAIEWSSYRQHGQMVADPFLVPGRDDEARLLVEEFNWYSERGRISELWGSQNGTGALDRIAPLGDESLHMSYPFVFEHDGSLYAIPECAESGGILLYKIDEATGLWNRQGYLIENVKAVDATLFRFENRWWLMHSGTEGCEPWSLSLWHADDFRGPWTPHPANPVKTDLSSSRPAGNLFWHEGQLYRPAQDERSSYGGGLTINRVDELTETTFRETVVRRIQPDPNGLYPDGIHTLSGYGNRSVVDAKKHRWPIGLILKRVLAKRLKFAPRGFRYSPPIVLVQREPERSASAAPLSKRS
jgi:hypothetical protein